MKKLIAAVSLVVLTALSGCAVPGAVSPTATAQQTAVLTTLAKFQSQAVAACNVIQPILTAAGLIDPSIHLAATANGLLCTALASTDLETVKTMSDTGIPAVESAVNASTLLPADKKDDLILALGAFQGSLNAATQTYTSATPASK
ncbi:hypothetical protein [Paraburkholderia unamae]|uniref:Uncharacterized protein n=1 Tax=Paraburkholderia unamae TaxID=219649 RepID=A0ACC6RHC6_9BURK